MSCASRDAVRLHSPEEDTVKRVRWIVLVVVVVIAAGCSTPATPAQQIVKETAPTATPVPSTATPVPVAESGQSKRMAVNHIGTQGTEDALIVDLRRAVVADKVWLSREMDSDFDEMGEDYEAATLVGEFIMVLRNGSGQTLSVYPDQCTVIVSGPNGTRQADIVWSSSGIAGLDQVGGEIYADVSKVGGFWYPFPAGVTMVDVERLTFKFNAAHDENFDSVGEDFSFEIDFSGQPDEPLDESVTAL